MIQDTKKNLEKEAERLGCSPEALCARLAKKQGVDGRVVVRSRSGGLRVVRRGEKLQLREDEFITAVPRAMEVFAEKELTRTGRPLNDSDLSD